MDLYDVESDKRTNNKLTCQVNCFPAVVPHSDVMCEYHDCCNGCFYSDLRDHEDGEIDHVIHYYELLKGHTVDSDSCNIIQSV